MQKPEQSEAETSMQSLAKRIPGGAAGVVKTGQFTGRLTPGTTGEAVAEDCRGCT